MALYDQRDGMEITPCEGVGGAQRGNAEERVGEGGKGRVQPGEKDGRSSPETRTNSGRLAEEGGKNRNFLTGRKEKKERLKVTPGKGGVRGGTGRKIRG